MCIRDSSKATEAQARELGIPLLTIDEVDHVDLDIDGVDEIDPQFNAIKGGGGALYREKVVATLAKEVIWIMDESKLVDHIGAFHLPVEIAQYGSKQAMARMEAVSYTHLDVYKRQPFPRPLTRRSASTAY